MLVAFLLALPMGWVESPPYFTALMETACDLSNTQLRCRSSQRPLSTVHRLEAVAATPLPTDAASDHVTRWATPPCAQRRVTGRPPTAAVDVYVDDFLLSMAQTQHHKQEVLRAALHSIDAVFRPLSDTDPARRKEPASVKKTLQGDAVWSRQKRILGWDIDTQASTLALPPHRIERLYELLDHLSPPRKRVNVKFWHQLLGELRSMAPALPGARGLFSILQDSLRRSAGRRVRLTRPVRDMVDDFRALAATLHQRPTRLQELVPTTPTFVGASDASGVGMGGVWFDPQHPDTFPPTLWRAPFSPDVRAALVSSDNPTGAIPTSDLELAALIVYKDVLAHLTPTAEHTLWIATDNMMAALSWSTRGSSTSSAARAYLLRFNALHQREHRYVAVHDHIAGASNSMADDASRLWHLTDRALLTHFDSTYPQALPWRLSCLLPSTRSTLTGALFCRRQTNAFLTSASTLPQHPGNCGPSSANLSTFVPNASPRTPSSLSSKSSPNVCPTAPSPRVAGPSDLARWRTPCVQWARLMPAWAPRTLA